MDNVGLVHLRDLPVNNILFFVAIAEGIYDLENALSA